MSRSVSVTEVLDEAEDVASRVLGPWGGVLWLSALPLRMLQIHFLDRLAFLGEDAPQYGRHLGELALLTTAALVAALAGRVWFVRACTLSLRTGAVPGREVWAAGAGPMLTYLYVGLFLEAAFVLTAPLVAVAPLLVLLSGLAAATSPLQSAPALVSPWRHLASQLRHLRVCLALLVVFGIALLLVYVNLYVLFRVGAWAAGGLPGVDAGAWSGLLDFGNRSFRLLLGAGAILVVEPFWLASLVVLVQQSMSRVSGEDLRIAWQRLRSEAAG